MRFLARLVVLAFGLGCAVTAGILFLLVAGLTEPAVGELFAGLSLASVFAFLDGVIDSGDPGVVAGGLVFALWGLASLVFALPPLLTAIIGELGGIRSFVWYSGATGALTAALPWLARGSVEPTGGSEQRVTLVLFLTGAVAGLVYWAIAGRSAAARRPDVDGARR